MFAEIIKKTVTIENITIIQHRNKIHNLMEYNLLLIVDNSFLLPVIAVSTNKKYHQINTILDFLSRLE